MDLNGWIIVGVVGFLAGLIVPAILLVLTPADYFRNGAAKDSGEPKHKHPVWWALRNLLGILIVIAGVIMLAMPGQGLLTIMIGLILVDFPGKRRLIRSLLRRPKLLHAANALRAKFGKPAFELPDDLHQED